MCAPSDPTPVRNFIHNWRNILSKLGGALGGSNQSVSFRSGTNVEFSPAFMRNGPQDTSGPIPVSAFDFFDLHNRIRLSTAVHSFSRVVQRSKRNFLNAFIMLVIFTPNRALENFIPRVRVKNIFLLCFILRFTIITGALRR